MEAVSEMAPGISDRDVIELALSGGRTLLTEDRDFGRLVFAHSTQSGGVIYLRFSMNQRHQMVDQLVHLITARAEDLVGAFTVVQPGRVRIGRLP